MVKYITYKSGIFISYKIELLALSLSNLFLGFLCGSAGKESACNAGDLGLIPWRRERLLTPVFWPGEFHGQYSPWDHKESDMTE